MDREEWDIQEVKQLKKKELIQLNLAMLLIFALAMYFAYNGNHILIIGMLFY
ncbi:hypothetical protein [Alkalibacillus salilacus]|uniref:Uncharacterized protein n=1 Tax=Alkalibacillus salilacus TaxID=284582 RepID=A0ABT9VEW6_9BACI|nr:hypothetical protein [Alkalibacillus salilacus]MDQ0159504.1 hypothetical protein [Alkalibacillus salilacus]